MSLPKSLPERAPLSLLKRVISTHEVVAYFTMALAFSWLVVLPVLLARNNLVSLPKEMSVELFLIAGAIAGPTLSAFIVTVIGSRYRITD